MVYNKLISRILTSMNNEKNWGVDDIVCTGRDWVVSKFSWNKSRKISYDLSEDEKKIVQFYFDEYHDDFKINVERDIESRKMKVHVVKRLERIGEDFHIGIFKKQK